MATRKELQATVLGAVDEQIGEQQQTAAKVLELALLDAGCARFLSILPSQTNTEIKEDLDSLRGTVSAILGGGKPLIELGRVLAELYSFRERIQAVSLTWLATNVITSRESSQIDEVLLELISRTRQILSARPDVTAVMDDLAALKNLRGGPADAVAFHDFHVLQLATKSVWLHAFDNSLKAAVEQLYGEVVEASDQLPVALPPLDELKDATDLHNLLTGLHSTLAQVGIQPIPADVATAYGLSTICLTAPIGLRLRSFGCGDAAGLLMTGSVFYRRL